VKLAHPLQACKVSLSMLLLLVASATSAVGQGQVGGPPAADPSLTPSAELPPPGFMRMCLKLIEQRRYAEVRRMLEPVVADHPGWARAHFYLALTYHKQNRYGQARELYERTLQIDPAYHTAKPFYGWCLYYLGELARSREQFEAFLAVRPGYPDAIFALGLIDFDDDVIDSAGARFTEAARLAAESEDRSTEAKSRARLADVHVRTGDLDKARQELQRSVELNPDNYETYFKLSRVLQRLGDAVGAEQARLKHVEVRERMRPVTGTDPPAEGP